MPIKVFISYASEDEKHLEALERHLTALRQSQLIETWNAQRILPGASIRSVTDRHFEEARLILLLISAEYLASQDAWQEMRRAAERRQGHPIEVVPIIVRACDWLGTPISHLQPLPRDGRPVMSWEAPDRAWTTVVTAIRHRVEMMLGQEPTVSAGGQSRVGAPAVARTATHAPVSSARRGSGSASEGVRSAPSAAPQHPRGSYAYAEGPASAAPLHARSAPAYAELWPEAAAPAGASQHAHAALKGSPMHTQPGYYAWPAGAPAARAGSSPDPVELAPPHEGAPSYAPVYSAPPPASYAPPYATYPASATRPQASSPRGALVGCVAVAGMLVTGGVVWAVASQVGPPVSAGPMTTVQRLPPPLSTTTCCGGVDCSRAAQDTRGSYCDTVAGHCQSCPSGRSYVGEACRTSLDPRRAWHLHGARVDVRGSADELCVRRAGEPDSANRCAPVRNGVVHWRELRARPEYAELAVSTAICCKGPAGCTSRCAAAARFSRHVPRPPSTTTGSRSPRSARGSCST